MGLIKDRLYESAVRKNGRVWYEYERYVREHIEEHRKNRIKHLWVLFKLNWFYRIKHGNTPYLYWDTPLAPKKQINIPRNTSGNQLIYPEMLRADRMPTDALVEMLSKYDVISFDVFDTLILRYVSDPKDVFILVGNKFKYYDYKTVRVRAEEDARRNSINQYGEVTLGEICQYVSNYVGVSKEKAEEIEFQTEKEVCYANPYMLAVAKTLAAKGKTIIATSNMYLGTSQIRELLSDSGYDFIEQIYVSCDVGLSKYKGNLQKYVWKQIGEDLSVIHVGDNWNSDFVSSRMIGWDSYYYKNCNDIGREYRPAKMSKLVSSVYGGIINGHFHNGLNSNESIYYELGFGYLGILVVGFCKWINEYCKLHDVDKILFTSRDMRLVYDIYMAHFHEFDCDYIKVSRFAAQRFSYKRFSDYYIDSHIKARALIKSLKVKEVLKELDIEFMGEYLDEYGLDEDDLFSMDNYPDLRNLLNTHKDRMLSEFEEEKNASIQYYSQFVSSDQKIAIVDLGWQGSNALCLKYLFENEMDMGLIVKSLLLASSGTREFVSNSFCDRTAEAYCFSTNMNEQMCKQFSLTAMGRFLTEFIFMPNEKSLKKILIDENGQFTFTYIVNEKRDANSIEEIFRGAKDFVQIWTQTNIYEGVISGFDAILPLNKFSYNKICRDIFDGNEINPWIGETKSRATSEFWKKVK